MWRFLMGAIAAALAVGVAGAGAGHEASGVKSYTGCLNPFGGIIYSVKLGDAPLTPCGFTGSPIHVSGGDITAVRAGPGLTGGSENGAATLSLAGGFSLPQSCANGNVPKWNGSTWVCGVDNDENTTPSETLAALESFQVASEQVGLGDFELKTIGIDCPDGSIVTGGGFDRADNSTDVRESRKALGTVNSWRMTAHAGLFGGLIKVFATCLRVR